MSFQRLMGSVLCGLPFASTYLDGMLVYSPNVECHKYHVFCHLQEAGHGRKYSIGVPEVCYSGHIFSADGIQPDPNKVHAAWATPTNFITLCQFLGLASYYVHKFADVAAPS